MTSKNDGPAKGAGKSAPEGPKKPSALLDLKATEVSSGEGKPPAAAETGASGAGAKPAAAPASLAPPKPAEPVRHTGSVPPAASAAAKPAASQGTAQTIAGAKAPKSSAGPESKPAAAPKPPGGIGRLLTHLAAGVAGGFLALLLADALGPRVGLSGGPSPQVVGDLQKRLTTAERAIAEQRSSPAVTAAELERKLADVAGRLARLDEIDRAVGALSEQQARLAGETKSLGERIGQPGARGELVERVAKLEQILATLTAAAGGEQPGRIPQLAAITGKLADLESTLPNQIAELRKSLSAELETRLAQSAEASEAARSATLRMDRELAASKTELARLSQRAEALKAADDRLEQTLRALQEEAGSLRSAADGLKGELAAQLKTVARAQDLTAAVTPVEGRIAALEQSVQGVVKSEADRRANAERIVLALELGNLKRALDRGGSYTAELSEVVSAGAGRIDLAVLERYKDQGVPTLSELTREFRPVAHAVLDAASMPSDASAFDRLLHGAKSVVRVRRTDHGPDDTSVEAIVGRMEAALAEGKLSEILAHARQLPPKALEPAEAWLARVEARAAVGSALASVEDQLKASLSGKAPVEKRTR
ncbi:MAG: hypothetical protein KJZ80_13425 [Hyphomicrobiaceae bacterium]|nr:hypothetical protein [Hyphomicrobiaceae bacterium]